MINNLVIDTHVLLWLLHEGNKIPNDIKQKIDLAAEEGGFFISSISLWEIAMLASKKRINVYKPIRDFVESVAQTDGLIIKDISTEIAVESVSLENNFHGDPSDRIIVATTRVLGATLLTRDEKILKWAKSGNIKTIKV